MRVNLKNIYNNCVVCKELYFVLIFPLHSQFILNFVLNQFHCAQHEWFCECSSEITSYLF